MERLTKEEIAYVVKTLNWKKDLIVLVIKMTHEEGARDKSPLVPELELLDVIINKLSEVHNETTITVNTDTNNHSM